MEQVETPTNAPEPIGAERTGAASEKTRDIVRRALKGELSIDEDTGETIEKKKPGPKPKAKAKQKQKPDVEPPEGAGEKLQPGESKKDVVKEDEAEQKPEKKAKKEEDDKPSQRDDSQGDREDEQEPEESEEPEKAASQEDEQDTDETSEETEEVKAPSFLKGEKREQYKALPKEAREMVDGLAKDAHRLATQSAQEAAAIKRAYQNIDRAVTPYLDGLAQRGLSPEVAIPQLLKFDAESYQDPLGAAARLLKRQGITAEQLMDYEDGKHPSQSSDGAAVDPDYIPPAVKEKLDRYEQFMAQQRAQSISEATAKFREAHPDTSEVEDEMAEVITSFNLASLPNVDPGAILRMAYLYAKYETPEKEKQVISRQLEADRIKRKKVEAEAVARESERKLPRSGNGAGTNTPAVPRNTKDLVRAVLHGRVK